MNLKWSIITVYLHNKSSVEIELEKDSLNSIKTLMDSVETMQTAIKLPQVNHSEVLHLKEELSLKKEVMLKTADVWYEAWKGQLLDV